MSAQKLSSATFTVPVIITQLVACTVSQCNGTKCARYGALFVSYEAAKAGLVDGRSPRPLERAKCACLNACSLNVVHMQDCTHPPTHDADPSTRRSGALIIGKRGWHEALARSRAAMAMWF
ncbi:hypothetical protein F4801DRAFT_572698 [Xylaria longipes]|nr:hypothetical protein F4801DRAFT_572698 [Xylaria longipes]